MFRMAQLKPQHGWNAVAWELGIVTLGVLLALGAQQWADDLSWRSKAGETTAELRDEVRQHYLNAVELRVVQPCIYAQLNMLAQRIAASGERINPAPVYSEPFVDSYVLRMPNRNYRTSAWQAAVGDGVLPHIDPAMRRELSFLYARLDTLVAATSLNVEDKSTLFGMSRRVPLDARSRIDFLGTLDRLRGRVDFMAIQSGQTQGNIERAGLTPDKSEIARTMPTRGTYQFCKRMGLPLRPVEDAMKAIPD